MKDAESCGIVSEVISFVLGNKGKDDIERMANKLYEHYQGEEKFVSVLMSMFYKASKIRLPESFVWQQNEFFNRIFLND